MIAIILTLLIFISAFIQLNWSYYFNINFTPQILFTFSVFASLFLRQPLSFIIVFISGLFLDIFSAGIFGINMIIYISWFFLFKKIKAKIFRDQPITQALIIFFGVIVNFLILAIFTHNFFLKLVILNAFFSAVLGLIIFSLLKKMFKAFKVKIAYR